MPLFLGGDEILEDEVGQLDHKGTKPDIFLDQRRQRGAHFGIRSLVFVAVDRRRPEAVTMVSGRRTRIPHQKIPWHELTPAESSEKDWLESASKMGRFRGQTTALVQRIAGVD